MSLLKVTASESLLSQLSPHESEAAETENRAVATLINPYYWYPHKAMLFERDQRRNARFGSGSTFAYHFSGYYHLMRHLIVTITVHQSIQDKYQGDG